MVSLVMVELSGTSHAKQSPHALQFNTIFPLYTAIIDNVSFWENIYSRYPNNYLLVHDREDLRKVYAAIPLINADTLEARKKNTLTEERVKIKYEQILKRLVDNPPKTKTEKRVAALFKGEDRAQELQKASQLVRTQNGQKQRFQKSVIRSGAYLEELKKIFRSYNLPEDLAYIPHVESSFHLGAYSRAGAAGIWQFTRSTGRRYLIIDDAVDQRLDPIAATHAAAQYFLLSQKYLNHWPLTVTSYNYGLPGTIRAKKEYGSYTKIFNSHRTGIFQFASRNFYSEFLAARKVAKKLEKTLQLNTPEKTLSLQLKGYLNLSDVTYYFRIGEKELKRLNPALRPSVFNGERRITKGYTLHLPATSVIQQRITSFPEKLYYTTAHLPQTRYYTVRKGDTINKIAARLNMSTKALRHANNINQHGFIKENQRIRIPGKTVSTNLPTQIKRSENAQKGLQNQALPLLEATRKKIHKKGS